MINSSVVYSAENIQEITLRPGDHVRVYSLPLGPDDARFLNMKVEDNHRARGKIPPVSGWSLETGVENCTSGEGGWSFGMSSCLNDSCPAQTSIAFKDTPSMDVGNQFVTKINGYLTTCPPPLGGTGLQGGGRLPGWDHDVFSVLLTDKDTIHIQSNPANVKVSTEVVSHWIKLKAIKWINGDPEQLEEEIVVDWTPIENVQFSKDGGATVMTDVDVEIYEGTTIWAKSLLAGVYTLKATNSGDSFDEIEGTLNVLNADLDAMKVKFPNVADGELPEGEEATIGAFVPINNDDDDYDAGNMADKDQTGRIVGESDLLPIKLHKLDPFVASSFYTLDIPPNVKIWAYSDRSGEVISTTEFNANFDTSLYVEGIDLGAGNIKLNLKCGTTVLDDCDEIKVTVFDWKGPLNVPGFSVHQYTANEPLETSKWIAPQGGTIKTGGNTSDVTIHWAEGPVVGKAIYHVNDNYVWGLEVNVVQIKIKQGDSNSIVYPDIDDASPVQSTINPAVIISSPLGINAMTANLTVEKIEGPSVDGNRRGVKFIEMGITQDVVLTRLCGNYDEAIPKVKRQSSMADGVRYLDGNPNGIAPWYEIQNNRFAQPDSDDTVENQQFKIHDRPALRATDYMILPITPPSLGKVSSFEMEIDFNLYFAVRTTDERNGANMIVSQRGSANWKFDGSGNIDAEGVWEKTGTGVSGSNSFSEVTSGALVPTTTVPWATNVLSSSTFSTVIQ